MRSHINTTGDRLETLDGTLLVGYNHMVICRLIEMGEFKLQVLARNMHNLIDQALL